jgi:hypothetical protein
MRTRDELHRLVDQLPEGEFDAAGRYLEYLRLMYDPVVKAFLEAPEDDEPETKAERMAVEEAKEALRRGEAVSDAELAQELGL